MEEITKASPETSEMQINNSRVEICNSDSAPTRLECYSDLSKSITVWNFSASADTIDPTGLDEEEYASEMFDGDEEEEDDIEEAPTSSGTLSVIVRVSPEGAAQVAALQHLLADGDGESFTVFCHYRDIRGIPIITSMFVCDSIEWGSLYGESKRYAQPLELELNMNVLYYDLMKPSSEFPGVLAVPTGVVQEEQEDGAE